MALSETDPVHTGDIYWINLKPKGGREQQGRRPCVVMSRLAINRGNPVVVVPLTTNLGRANAYNIQIPGSEIIAEPGGSQPQTSVALCGQLFAVDKRKFETKFGKLSQNAILAIQLGITFLFDIR